jgi:hypothetical protein
MQDPAFEERRRALENEFFYRVDQDLLARLRKKFADQAARRALAAASGVTDDVLLDELVQLGIAPPTLGAVSLIPLVLVAWADRGVDAKERRAVLNAAVENGVAPDGAAYRLLEFWLENEPPPQLAEVWRHFVKVVLPSLTEETSSVFRDEIMKQARKAAKASRPGLGTKKISAEETRVLNDLESAFSRAGLRELMERFEATQQLEKHHERL